MKFMCPRTFFAGFLCLAFVLLCHSSIADQNRSVRLYTLPSNASAAADFRSSRPDVVSVKYLPGGGNNGRGAVVFQILKPFPEEVEITGPALKLEKRSPFVSLRQVKMDAMLKMKNAPDNFFQIRFRIGKNTYASSPTPRRFWETIIDPGPAREWNDWNTISRYGTLYNGTTSGEVVLLVNAAKGQGEFLLEQFLVEEVCTTDHLIKAASPYNTFTAEKGEVAIRYVDPEKMLSGKLLISDEENRTVKEMNLSPGTVETTYLLPHRGFYNIKAEVRYSDGRRIVTERSAAVVGPRIPEPVRRASRFGLCRVWANSDWGQLFGSSIDYGGWNLRNIKPGPDGKLLWSGNPGSWDTRFITHAAMFEPLPPCLLKAADRGKVGMYPPEDWNRLAEAVKLWAKNTPVLPDVVNIFNEPNGQWRGTKAELAKLHNVIADSIKSVRPEAKVGGPGFYSINTQELKEYVDLGILKNMDWLVMHAYVNATPPEEEFIEKIISMQEYLKTTPYAKLPIAFTEYGWTGVPGDWQKPVTELEKARYCARSLILCTVRDIAHIAYFAGRYNPSPTTYNYSIIKPDYTPLPAMASYSALIRELATVKGGGIWLKLAPGVHAALFRRGNSTIGAFWTMKARIAYELPMQPNYLRSMTGTPLTLSRKAELTPSPVYAEFPGTALAEIAEQNVKQLLPGASFEVSGDEVIAPPFLERNGNRFSVPTAAPLGDYAILTRKGNSWQVHRYRVIEPVTASFHAFDWDGKKSSDPELKFRILSRLPGSAAAALELKLEDGRSFRQNVKLVSGKTEEVLFRIPNAVNGRRYPGSLTVSIERPIRWTSRCSMDVTPLAIPCYSSDPGKNVWEKIAPIPMNDWNRPGEIKEKERSVTPAFFRAYATPDGFHLQVTANDPELKRDAQWTEMWKEDSLQLAFDLDADREWLPNNIGNGFNGHRVVEYAVAYPTTQKNPEAWCFMGYADGVRSGPAFELMTTSSVVRRESEKLTIYTIFLPWRLLGAKKAPLESERIGFALLLNDANGRSGRKMVGYFGGIVNKNPLEYGKIRLVRQP